ncbi:hypothetical protein [Streptomyces sp. NPDC054975]
MSMDAEQSRADWIANEHGRAQASAVYWADRAVLEHEEAQHYEAQDRRQAQEHAALSTEARHLAEMWACVANALSPARLAPLPLTADRTEP